MKVGLRGSLQVFGGLQFEREPSLDLYDPKGNLSFRVLKVQLLEFISKVNGFWVVSELGVKGEP